MNVKIAVLRDTKKGAPSSPSAALWPPLLLAAAAAVYAAPLLRDPWAWGRLDWDQFTFWNAAPREALVRYHQLPLWNPWSNGGNVLLAMPHSSFLSPLYLPVLLCGPVLGLKLLWGGAALLGMLGMHALARRFEMGTLSALLPPLVFMLSSHYSLHLREGHAEWTVMSLLPWAFLFALDAADSRRALAKLALTLALMIGSGGVYPFAITVSFLGFHALACAALERRRAPLLALAGALALTLLLSAVKTVPMLELLASSPRPTVDTGRLEAVLLPKLLLRRDQNALYEDRPHLAQRLGMAWDRENWHEFGAYIGLPALLLALLGLHGHFRRQRALFWTGLACLYVAMGRTAWFVDLWALLHKLPVYRSLQVPSRWLLAVLLCASLFAGLGLSDLEKKASKGWQRALLALLLLGVFADLVAVTRPILANAFPLAPLSPPRAAQFRQGGLDFGALRAQGSNSAMYPALLANQGTIKSYDIVGVPRGAVKDSAEPGYRGEAYLASGRGEARVVSFTPNVLVVEAVAEGEDRLVLNQNHHRGWRWSDGGGWKPTQPSDGLISAPLPAGRSTVTFRFRPPSFALGLLLSAAGAAVAAALLRRPA